MRDKERGYTVRMESLRIVTRLNQQSTNNMRSMLTRTRTAIADNFYRPKARCSGARRNERKWEREENNRKKYINLSHLANPHMISKTWVHLALTPTDSRALKRSHLLGARLCVCTWGYVLATIHLRKTLHIYNDCQTLVPPWVFSPLSRSFSPSTFSTTFALVHFTPYSINCLKIHRTYRWGVFLFLQVCVLVCLESMLGLQCV